MNKGPKPDLAALLTETARERKWPNVRPRDAATLILLDRSGADPKILMGRRHSGHRFMPGKFVFPGGRIDPSDRRMPFAGCLAAAIEDKLLKRVSGATPSRPRALALAAIRETYEETGLLLGAKAQVLPKEPPPGAWASFTSHGVMPSLEGLYLIARAITPPRRPRRFDTSFFAADAQGIAGSIEGIAGPQSELVELVWLSLDKAKRLDLAAITGVMIDELQARLKGGMGHDLPVPFYYERNRRWIREEL